MLGAPSLNLDLGCMTLARAAKTTGIKRRTLRSWVDKGRIALAHDERYPLVLDEDSMPRIAAICRIQSRYAGLVSAGMAAELIGVNTVTFYNYELRGIPLPLVDPSHVVRLVSGCRCLDYEPDLRRLRLKPIRFVESGYGHFDKATVSALRTLNEVVCREWVPLDRFVESLAEVRNETLSLRDGQRLRRKTAALCAKGQIRADRGLSCRHWYVAPSVARRATLRFVCYRYKQLFLLLGSDLRLVEQEIHRTVRPHAPGVPCETKASLYAGCGQCVGFIFSDRPETLKDWASESIPLPPDDLRRGALASALDRVCGEMRMQRRRLLPTCRVAEEGPWKVILPFVRRKLRAREFRPSGTSFALLPRRTRTRKGACPA